MKQSWKTGVTDEQAQTDRAEFMGPAGKAGWRVGRRFNMGLNLILRKQILMKTYGIHRLDQLCFRSLH